MTRSHDVSEADLVGYADGELRGARREVVEAHVQACSWCRERLAAFRASSSLVRSATPLVDHPVVVAMVRARLEEARGKPFLPAPRPALTALVLLAVVLAAWPASSAAGFGLERFVRLGADKVFELLPGGWDRSEPPGLEGSSGSAEHWSPTQLPAAALGEPVRGGVPVDGPLAESVGLGGPDPAVGDARQPSFPAVEPADLPLGWTRVERSAPSEDRLEQVYANPNGLEIRLIQAPAGSGTTAIMPGSWESVVIGDTEALLIPGSLARQEVVGLVWERADVVFEMLVLGSPAGKKPLTMEDASRIVEALAAEQDRAAAREEEGA